MKLHGADTNIMEYLDIPGYEVMSEIGTGGMATVHLAMQESLNRRVAIKVLSASLMANPDFRQRFLKEAQIIAKLQHPHIVTIHDIGEQDGRYYMVMELLEGGHLKARIERGLKGSEIIRILTQICSALSYAHSNDILHRDIKPRNILFRNNRTAILTDFGIAKDLGDANDLTVAGISMGSPLYMSPEQLSHQKLDHRSDIYSLGFLLYELLTGTYPYKSDSLANSLKKRKAEPIPMLPESHKRFQPLLNKLMAPNRDKRFQSVIEFSKALEDTVLPDTIKRRKQPSGNQTGTQTLRKATTRTIPETTSATTPEPTPETAEELFLELPREDHTSTQPRRNFTPLVLTLGLAAFGALLYLFYTPQLSNLASQLQSDETTSSQLPAEAYYPESTPPAAENPMLSDTSLEQQELTDEPAHNAPKALKTAAGDTTKADLQNTSQPTASLPVEAKPLKVDAKAEKALSEEKPDTIKPEPSASELRDQVVEEKRRVLSRLSDPGIELNGQRFIISQYLEKQIRPLVTSLYRQENGNLIVTIDAEKLFVPDSAQLSSFGQGQLDQLAYVFRNYSGFSIGVRNNADPTGQSTAWELSTQRSQTIRDYFAGPNSNSKRIYVRTPKALAAESYQQQVDILLKPTL